MKYRHGTRRRALEYEADLVKYWKDNKIFEKSVDNRPTDNSYIFFDGPPFITGVPHHGTLLSSIVKDAIPRYQTMKGKSVERTWGWDCHGLPAEVFTEQKLGIKDKREIGTKISLEDYIKTCRENMVTTGDLWESTIDRIGRWVDFKGAYKTMDKNYMESVWWAFKELYDKGKIYEGEKVLMYCTRDATPISKAEVAMDNSYQDVTDPSVYVKFKLVDTRSTSSIGGAHGEAEKHTESYHQYDEGVSEDSTKRSSSDVYLLAWTTTPWTLNANTAIAVNKDVDYVHVLVGGENLIIAKKLVDKVLTDEKHQVLDYEVVHQLKGADLVGKSYEPLFGDRGGEAHKIWHADFVHDEEGTGIAHEAPAYGEDDYLLAKANNIPLVIDTDDEGFYTEGPWKGQQVWEVNKQIAKDLHEQGVVWKINYITHSYPHCHRCGTKLMYRAHPSWFMNIDGQRSLMLEQNEDINWYPGHVKHGRFQNTVESAPDWNISRDRFWATAMPIWKGTDAEGKEHVKVIGSYQELKDLSGVELEDYHRPWIDEVTFEIDGVKYSRIDKVMDCWFESGSMPFAQFHYPFENKEKFDANRQADFIVEYVGQVRAWFYYMHAVSVGLFGEKSFKNVIVTGTLAGNDGRKMSKSFGNYTDPNELMDAYSADSLRFLLLSSPVLNGEDYSLQDKDVGDVARKLSMVWNMYDFFTMYAEVDNWEWNGSLDDPSPNLTNIMDLWIVSRLHQLNQEVDECLAKYDLQNACKPILEFLDDASNWYVRRSRRRFWKSEDDSDKNDAYTTLHYVLTQLSMIMAPFTPFLAEELYRKMTDGESVHLLDWPVAGFIHDEIVDRMKITKDIITEGLAIRAKAGIKVRQPLASVTAHDIPDEYKSIILEELNVKQMLEGSEFGLDLNITDELRAEGMVREVIRHVQNARKNAGLNVDDRINLVLSTENDELNKAINQFKEEIWAETLTQSDQETAEMHQESVKIDGAELQIHLSKI